MTQFLILLEGFKTLTRIPFIRYLVIGGGFYLLIGYRFCDRHTEVRSESTEPHYTPKYGKLSDDLLDSVLINLVRQNPDITADIALSYVNDTTLIEIDRHIEKSRKYITNFKITRGGGLAPIEQ
jgi:hypothetical protein